MEFLIPDHGMPLTPTIILASLTYIFGGMLLGALYYDREKWYKSKVTYDQYGYSHCPDHRSPLCSCSRQGWYDFWRFGALALWPIPFLAHFGGYLGIVPVKGVAKIGEFLYKNRTKGGWKCLKIRKSTDWSS